jgi:hypothetical protein
VPAVFSVVALTHCAAPFDDTAQPTEIALQPAREEPVIMTVTLPGEPASEYRANPDDRSTGTIAGRLQERFPSLKPEPCLERAAGIYARTARADDLPLAFSEFVLHWAGCPDPFATIAHVLTSDSDDREFLAYLGQTLATIDATHVGAAKVPASAPYAWRWTVFLTDRRFEMQSVPTAAAPGTSLVLVLRFLERVDSAKVVSTSPDGTVTETDAGLSGDRMLASVDLADRPGTQWIEVMANDSRGPHVVALFPVEVGRSPARAWIGKTREGEDWITDPVLAEDYAVTLLQEDRGRFGLPPLVVDHTLASVARRHSAEMAASGEIAHFSPITGTVADRLESADFAAFFAAENVARSSSIADAQEGLMRSPGHRAAILSTEVTHVGVGIASRHGPETGTVHFITQVFARPVD